MIIIKLYGLSDKDSLTLLENKIKIEVEGHADYDEYSKDIVCAAVSTLVQTGIYAIQKLTELVQTVEKEKGFLSIEIDTNNNRDNNKLITILETILIGIKEIYKQYPENIKIEYY